MRWLTVLKNILKYIQAVTLNQSPEQENTAAFKGLVRYTEEGKYHLGSFQQAPAEDGAKLHPLATGRTGALHSRCGYDTELHHITYHDVADLGLPYAGHLGGWDSVLYRITPEQEAEILRLEQKRALDKKIVADWDEAIREDQRRTKARRAQLPEGATVEKEAGFAVPDEYGKSYGRRFIIRYRGRRYGYCARNIFDVGLVINPFLHVAGGLAVNVERRISNGWLTDNSPESAAAYRASRPSTTGWGWDREGIANAKDPRVWVAMNADELAIYTAVKHRIPDWMERIRM